MDFNKKKRLQHEGTSHNPFQQNIWEIKYTTLS